MGGFPLPRGPSWPEALVPGGPEGPAPVPAVPPAGWGRGWHQSRHGGTAGGVRGSGPPPCSCLPSRWVPSFCQHSPHPRGAAGPAAGSRSPLPATEPRSSRAAPLRAPAGAFQLQTLSWWPKSNCATSSSWPPPALSLPARGQPSPCPAPGATAALRPHVLPVPGTAPRLPPAQLRHGVLAAALPLAQCAPAWPGAGDYSWRGPGLCTCPWLNSVLPISGGCLQVPMSPGDGACPHQGSLQGHRLGWGPQGPPSVAAVPPRVHRGAEHL